MYSLWRGRFFCLKGDINTCGNNELEAGEECDGEASYTIDCTWEETAGEDPASEIGEGEDPAGEIGAGEDPAGEIVAGEITPICGNGVIEGDEECDG